MAKLKFLKINLNECLLKPVVQLYSNDLKYMLKCAKMFIDPSLN